MIQQPTVQPIEEDQDVPSKLEALYTIGLGRSLTPVIAVGSLLILLTDVSHFAILSHPTLYFLSSLVRSHPTFEIFFFQSSLVIKIRIDQTANRWASYLSDQQKKQISKINARERNTLRFHQGEVPFFS